MDQGTLDKWNGGKYQKGMSRQEREKVGKRATESKLKAGKSRDKLGNYLSKQFTKAEEGDTSDEDSGSSYDELTDSDFGVNPASGRPGGERKRDGDDDYDYVEM